MISSGDDISINSDFDIFVVAPFSGRFFLVEVHQNGVQEVILPRVEVDENQIIKIPKYRAFQSSEQSIYSLRAIFSNGAIRHQIDTIFNIIAE